MKYNIIKTSITVLLFAFLAIGYSQFSVMNTVGKDFEAVCEVFYSDSNISPSSKECDGLLIGETTWLDSEYSVLIEPNSQGVAKSMTLGTVRQFKKNELDSPFIKQQIANIQDFYNTVLSPIEKMTMQDIQSMSLSDLETPEEKPLATWASDDQETIAVLYITKVAGLYSISTHIQSYAEKPARAYSSQNEASEAMVDFSTTLFKALSLEPFQCPDMSSKNAKSGACGFTNAPFIRSRSRIDSILDDYTLGKSRIVINPWELSVVQGDSIYQRVIMIDQTVLYMTFIDMGENSALVITEMY